MDKVISGNEKMRQIVDDAYESHILSLDNNLDGYTEQSIFNLLWGFDKADVDNKQVFDKWIDAAIKRKDEFGKEGLENLLQWTE